MKLQVLGNFEYKTLSNETSLKPLNTVETSEYRLDCIFGFSSWLQTNMVTEFKP